MTASPARDPGIDVARGVAVLSMFVAHFAPTPGPARVLVLSEHLTAPLFAFLIGWGAWLGRERPGLLASTLVRAAALVGGGLALERVGSQILIVLVWLGVLTLLAAVLVRLPSPVLAALAVGLLLAVPSAQRWGERRATTWRLADLAAGGDGAGLVPRLYDLAVAGPSYRLTTFVALAAVAVLLARLDGPRLRVGSAGVAVVTATGLFAADRLGVLVVEPYAATWPAQLFVLALAVATVQPVRLVVAHGRTAGAVLVDLLAPLGAMTLSVYALHVGVSAWWVHDGRHASDDTWVLLAALSPAAIAFSLVWPRVVRAEPWRRGPAEGLERVAAGLLDRLLRTRRPLATRHAGA